MKYAELRRLAKAAGIKANMKVSFCSDKFSNMLISYIFASLCLVKKGRTLDYVYLC